MGKGPMARLLNTGGLGEGKFLVSKWTMSPTAKSWLDLVLSKRSMREYPHGALHGVRYSSGRAKNWPI